MAKSPAEAIRAMIDSIPMGEKFNRFTFATIKNEISGFCSSQSVAHLTRLESADLIQFTDEWEKKDRHQFIKVRNYVRVEGVILSEIKKPKTQEVTGSIRRDRGYGSIPKDHPVMTLGAILDGMTRKRMAWQEQSHV